MDVLRADEGGWERLSDLVYRRHVHGARVTIAQFRLLRGSSVKPHSHPHEQVSILVKGRVKFRVGDEEVIVGPGDVVHIPPGVIHGVEALEESLIVDVYSPVRDDWIRGEDKYLRG